MAPPDDLGHGYSSERVREQLDIGTFANTAGLELAERSAMRACRAVALCQHRRGGRAGFPCYKPLEDAKSGVASRASAELMTPSRRISRAVPTCAFQRRGRHAVALNDLDGDPDDEHGGDIAGMTVEPLQRLIRRRRFLRRRQGDELHVPLRRGGDRFRRAYGGAQESGVTPTCTLGRHRRGMLLAAIAVARRSCATTNPLLRRKASPSRPAR